MNHFILLAQIVLLTLGVLVAIAYLGRPKPVSSRVDVAIAVTVTGLQIWGQAYLYTQL